MSLFNHGARNTCNECTSERRALGPRFPFHMIFRAKHSCRQMSKWMDKEIGLSLSPQPIKV